MSVKLQKILLFIPAANIFLLICWPSFYLKNKLPIWRFLKRLSLMLLMVAAIQVPRALLNLYGISNTLEVILRWVSIYLVFVLFGYIAIKDQQNYYKI